MCTSEFKSNLKTSPTRIILLVTGCFSVVPPDMIIELLIITQEHSICEFGFGIGDKVFHFILSSNI